MFVRKEILRFIPSGIWVIYAMKIQEDRRSEWCARGWGEIWRSDLMGLEISEIRARDNYANNN